MSAIKSWTIMCDGCPGYEVANPDLSHTTAASARTEARGAGWKQVGSKDFCPDCVEERNL